MSREFNKPTSKPIDEIAKSINQFVQLMTDFDGTNQLTFDLTISQNQSTNSSIQPTSLGFNQPTLYTSDPVLFHAWAHYCLCLYPVVKYGHA